MIDRIEVRNFQSLRSVDLALGRFTVIVGASSSGKSALMRAFRAGASNLNGAGSITRGAKAAAITLHVGDHIVTLERTESSGMYRLVGANGAESRFTKLNRSVPQDITDALRIQPAPAGGTSINFASQFDGPYLLGDSGATVARVLGDLTNVSVILEAVRQANRERAAASATLKTRRADLADLVSRATAFRRLPEQLTACQRAEDALERAERLTDRLGRLRAATESLAVAEGVLARSTVLPEIPSDAALLQAHHRLDDFRRTLVALAAANESAAQGERQVHILQAAEEELVGSLREALVRAGQCPTCGQPVV